MKNNIKKISVLFLVALVAIGSYFVAGTYAKYSSEFSGSGDADVAKWSWTINGKDFTTLASVSEEFTIDPFAAVKDSDGTSTESDVASNLIAPGTTGSVSLDITNNSEVNAEYKVEFSATNSNNVPLQYSLDGTTWTNNISSLNIGTDPANNNGPVAIAMNGGTTIQNGQSTIKFYWKWAYENGTGSTLTTNDQADTALGFAANSSTPTVVIRAKVTATQVD